MDPKRSRSTYCWKSPKLNSVHFDRGTDWAWAIGSPKLNHLKIQVPLKYIGWVGLSEFLEGDRAGETAHGDGHDEDGNGALGTHGDREKRGAVGNLVNDSGEHIAGNEAAAGEDEHFLEEHGDEIAVAVADRFEGRVFGEVVGDVAVEDLVDDDDAHAESHGNADAEDEADACGAPVVLFDLCPFEWRENAGVGGESTGDRGFHLFDVGSGFELDESDFHFVGRPVGVDAHEGGVADDGVSVGGEG